ncbi:MAG: DUF5668 domain-containing protein [Candidatus Pacebacteria bacterium]|jgi:hypothetical protein|nr:DUF5668 domain-containing protein [Candidatus Paceibacterota bacterium]
MDGEQNNSPEENIKEEKKSEATSEKTPEKVVQAIPVANNPGFDFGKLLLGLFIISSGIFLLGKSAGYISQDLNIDFFQFWPLLIIAVGLSFLDTRRPLSFVIGLLVFVAVAALVGTMVQNGISENGSTQRRSTPIEIDKGADTNLAKIDIKIDVGSLAVGGGAKKLVEGNFESDYAQLEKTSSVSDRTQNIELKSSGIPDQAWRSFFGGGKSDLNLKLSSELSMELFFSLNVTDATIDLGEVTAKSVDIDSNVSDLELTLSDRQDSVDVKIKASVGQTKIVLPESSGVRVSLTSDISSQSLLGFEKISETEYRTSNYDTADKKIEMDLDIDVSNLEIVRR